MDRAESIDALELSVRSLNVLNKMGIKTIGCVLSKTYWELVALKGVGKKTIEDLVDALHVYGIRIPETPLENHIKRTPRERLVEMSAGEVQMLIQCPECHALPGHICALDWDSYGTYCGDRGSLSKRLLLERVGEKLSRAFKRFDEAQTELDEANRKVRRAKKVLEGMSPYVKRTFLTELDASKSRERRLELERIEKLKAKPNITVPNDDGSVLKVSAFTGETVAQFWYPTTGEEDECEQSNSSR